MAIAVGARGSERTGAAAVVAYAGAVAFVASAAWYGLATSGVTVDSEPTFSAAQGPAERLDVYYRWFGTTVQQEAFYGGIAVFGFLCLAATALAVRRRLADGATASLGAQGVIWGSVLWVVSDVEQIGGHHAVARMTSGGDLVVVNSIKFTVETVNDSFQLAAFLVIGAGLLAFVAAAPPGGWRRLTLVVTLVVLALAGAYAARAFDVVDVLLVAGGVIALPTWLVWTARNPPG